MTFYFRISLLKGIIFIIFLKNNLCNDIYLDSFSFYYDYTTDQIKIYDFSLEHNSHLNNFNGDEIPLNSFENIYEVSLILTEKNKITEYYSQALNGAFMISVYKLEINEVEFKVNLIKYFISDNIVKEIFFDLPIKKEKKYTSFPLEYKQYYELKQNKLASKKGFERRKKRISDIFGFEIKKKENYNYIKGTIDKVYIISSENNNIKYFADITSDLIKDKDLNKNVNIEINDFYLSNLPKKFDLNVFIKSNDENKNVNSFITLIKKNIDYPNFSLSKSNPNYSMLIITSSLILTTIILVAISMTIKSLL